MTRLKFHRSIVHRSRSWLTKYGTTDDYLLVLVLLVLEHPRVLILCCQSAKADQNNCFVWHPRELSFGYVKHWPQRSLQTEIQLSDKIVFYGIPGSCPSDMLVSDPILFFKPRFSLLRQLLNETKNDLKPSNTLQNNIGRKIKGEIFFNFWSQNPPKIFH